MPVSDDDLRPRSSPTIVPSPPHNRILSGSPYGNKPCRHVLVFFGPDVVVSEEIPIYLLSKTSLENSDCLNFLPDSHPPFRLGVGAFVEYVRSLCLLVLELGL